LLAATDSILRNRGYRKVTLTVTWIIAMVEIAKSDRNFYPRQSHLSGSVDTG
jgi:hypothetical protein